MDGADLPILQAGQLRRVTARRHTFFKMLTSAAPPEMYSQILRLIENQDAE